MTLADQRSSVCAPRSQSACRAFAMRQQPPGFEAIARIHTAQEQLLQGASAVAAVEEAQAALATGLPAGAATNATFLALVIMENGEQYDQALRVFDLALEGARREGHTTRQGLIHGRRAAIALAQGSLQDAQVEAETGLLLVEKQHFVLLQLLAVAIVVHIERGALAAAAELAETGEAVGIAEDRLYVDQFLIARGRLRIAQGDVREGVADLTPPQEDTMPRRILTALLAGA